MSNPQNPYRYYGECTEIISGDTITLKLDLGFDLEKRVTLRLKNVDVSGTDESDESFDNMDMAPRDYLEIWFNSAVSRCTEKQWPLMVEVDQAPYQQGYEAIIYRRNSESEWGDPTSLSSSFLKAYGDEYKETAE